ncbi:hypothetical protein ACFLT8_07170 [Chloroflexota bacterium]
MSNKIIPKIVRKKGIYHGVRNIGMPTIPLESLGTVESCGLTP